MKFSLLKSLAGIGLLSALAACQPSEPAVSAPATAQIKPVASIQELMQAFVDPSADAIWESVSTTITKKGVEEKHPKTDEEWLAVRLHALRVIEGASLLQVPGRKVVQDGAKLEDDHVEGNAKLQDIGASIAKNPAAFYAEANNLQINAVAVLAAIDARDLQRIVKTGSDLDAACERCHSQYWYPNQQLPRWPAPLTPAK